MKKDYQKPEAELISLVAEENIAVSLQSESPEFGGIDGQPGFESTIF